ISFSIHDGDLKAGSGIAGSQTPTTCSDALYEQALTYFNSLQQPAFFTPGDNDWTDCDRPANGSFNEVEPLQHERPFLFSTAQSVTPKAITTEVQTSSLSRRGDQTPPPAPAAAQSAPPPVQTRPRTVHNVTFPTLNGQGTRNNLCSSGGGAPDAGGDPPEYAARNPADKTWLQQTFDEAKAN